MIEVVHADGRRRVVEVLGAPTRETVDEVAWAPNGESMLVVMVSWGLGHGEECDWTTTRLINVDLVHGRRTVVAEGPSITFPQWSPDGRRIAAYSDLGRGEVFVVGANARGERTIDQRIVDFGWTTDGASIVLLKPDAIRVESVTGGDARTVLRGGSSEFVSGSIADVSKDWVALPRSSSDYELVSLAGARTKHVLLGADRTGASSITLR